MSEFWNKDEVSPDDEAPGKPKKQPSEAPPARAPSKAQPSKQLSVKQPSAEAPPRQPSAEARQEEEPAPSPPLPPMPPPGPDSFDPSQTAKEPGVGQTTPGDIGGRVGRNEPMGEEPLPLSPDREEMVRKQVVLYERMTTEEFRWERNRERGPQTNLGWFLHICLCGPEPGVQPDPNEVWPGHLRKKKKHGKRKKTVAKAKKKEFVVREASGAQEFRAAVFEQVSGGTALSNDKAVVLARYLGFVPAQEDEVFLKTKICDGRDSCTSTEFDKWVVHLYHPEDQDKEALLAIFKVFDTNNTSCVSTFCFITLMSAYGEILDSPAVEALISKLDAGQGGSVNYVKFLDNLFAANRKFPNPETISQIGGNPSALPPRSQTEVTHFASPPSFVSSSDSWILSSDELESQMDDILDFSFTDENNDYNDNGDFWLNALDHVRIPDSMVAELTNRMNNNNNNNNSINMLSLLESKLF